MTLITRRGVLGAASGLLAAPLVGRAQATPIRIGEINSYTAIPAFTLPYRKGWQMAENEVNAKGGVLGRPLEVISRDDAGKPADAVRLANELVNERKVDLLAGGFLSNVELRTRAVQPAADAPAQELMRLDNHQHAPPSSTFEATTFGTPAQCDRRATYAISL
jgi:Periplasmic binding protein